MPLGITQGLKQPHREQILKVYFKGRDEALIFYMLLTPWAWNVS